MLNEETTIGFSKMPIEMNEIKLKDALNSLYIINKKFE